MSLVTVGGYLLAVIAGALSLRTKRGDVWRDEAEAYRAKAERLEADVAELRKEFTAYREATEGRIDRLETENRRLGELASSREAVAELVEIVTVNHNEIMNALVAHKEVQVNG